MSELKDRNWYIDHSRARTQRRVRLGGVVDSLMAMSLTDFYQKRKIDRLIFHVRGAVLTDTHMILRRAPVNASTYSLSAHS